VVFVTVTMLVLALLVTTLICLRHMSAGGSNVEVRVQARGCPEVTEAGSETFRDGVVMLW